MNYDMVWIKPSSKPDQLSHIATRGNFLRKHKRFLFSLNETDQCICRINGGKVTSAAVF